ncbi:hypothetical protein LINPERPRIM_LOCUS24122 [Linum perenne]
MSFLATSPCNLQRSHLLENLTCHGIF